MNSRKSLSEILGTKFGNDRSSRMMNRINHAYKNGTRGQELSLYLKGVLKAEGMGASQDIGRPPIIYSVTI